MRVMLRVALVLGLAATLCAQDNANQTERKPLTIAGDMPVDSPTILVVARGLVRSTLGLPLPNAVVEMVMNPYHPGPTSTKTWSATDSYGRYEVRGQGHHGTVRLRVAAEGHRVDFREVSFIKGDRSLEFTFSLGRARSDGREGAPGAGGER